MMGAAQPFISGAISKTVNLPNEASVEDIQDAYLQAWKMGLKCVAIYRDGSKRSQPLNTNKDDASDSAQSGSRATEENATLKAQIAELEKQIDSLQAQAIKPLRKRLPETRIAKTHKFEIAGHEGYLTVGLFDDGAPGELFITMAKEGSTIGGLMDSIATLTSIALQHGVPLQTLVKKFSHQRFEPSGFTKNPDIRKCDSIIDYVFRWLAFEFLDGYRQATEPKQPELEMPGLEEEEKKVVNKPIPELPIANDTEFIEKSAVEQSSGETAVNSLSATVAHFQQDAPTCPNCGNVVVRNGACYKCLNCGESLGCS